MSAMVRTNYTAGGPSLAVYDVISSVIYGVTIPVVSVIVVSATTVITTVKVSKFLCVPCVLAHTNTRS
jgi:hypothetical protein